MNVSALITQLQSKKAYLWIDKSELVIRVLPEVMTPGIVENIRNHKSEIIDYLVAANEETPKRFAYRYEFKNGAGAGTWITDIPPEQAESEFSKRFTGYEIEVLALIN